MVYQRWLNVWRCRLLAGLLALLASGLIASCGAEPESASAADQADVADQSDSSHQESETGDDTGPGGSTAEADDQQPAGPGETASDRSDRDSADDNTDDAQSANDTDAGDQKVAHGGDDELLQLPYGRLVAPLQVDGLVPSKRGDDGPAVAALQDLLTDSGISQLSADGDYGRKTEVAVAAFQRFVGLPSTGEADLETLDVLVRFRPGRPILDPGDEGEAVEELQTLLALSPLDPGTVDGTFGSGTQTAIWALEKLADLPIDGRWGPLDEWAFDRLQNGELTTPAQAHDDRWVEVDLTTQTMVVYNPDASPALISHISSGSGVPWSNEDHSGSSVTPQGDFAIQRRIAGWRESSLGIGRLYNPLYFVGGIAFHGATSVPLYPASHGCIRVPMHIADYLPDELPNGTPVHVGRTEV
jgi:peptidoglycan hydrolase-like protein with peptidoglycan-binding domain